MSVNRNLLVVIESLNLDDSSGAKTSVALLKGLYNAGFNVTALHYSQRDVNIENINCVAIKENRASILFFLSRVQRLLYRYFKVDIAKRVDTLFGFSFGFFNDSNSIKKAIEKYNPEQYEMIWTLSQGNSYRSHKAVLQLPQWYHKWYAYVHDPYPQQLYPRPYNFVPYGYKQKRMFFKQVTIKAKRVVFPSLMLKEWLQSYYVEIEGKSLIIPHQMLHYDVADTLPEYFDSQKFVLMHGGNLLDLRDPKRIVEAYGMFLKKNPKAKDNSKLIFLGNKSKFSEYLKKMMTETPQLYASENYVPFGQVYTMQQKATVNIILEAKSEISPFLPGKFPHCVAANKPILHIGPYYSECKRLLGKDYPYQFDFDEVDKMANAFEVLYKSWQIDNKNLVLNRSDLEHYLSSEYIKEVLNEEELKLS